MSFASVGTLGTNISKASGTTVVVTTSATAEAGNLVAVHTAWDNTATADGASTNLSCTDSAGNEYLKAVEWTETEAGAAADGVTVAIFVSVLTSQLASGGTITFTSDTARVAKAASGWEFTLTEAAVAIEAADGSGGSGGGAAGQTLAGLTGREYLLLHSYSFERGETIVYTQDGDYTDLTPNGTTGGAANSNLVLRGGFRIATLTGDTVSVSVAEAVGEFVNALAAVYEVADVGAFELDAQPGTFAVTGAAASPLADRAIPADPGSFAVTGAAAAVPAGRVVSALPGAYTLTGAAAGTLADRLLNAAAGSFTVTGVAADLVYQPTAGAFELNAEPGGYTITGAAASPIAGRLFNAAAGAYVLTGTQASAVAGRALNAQPGAVSVTGSAAGLLAAKLVVASPGGFTLTGAAAGLAYSAAEGPPAGRTRSTPTSGRTLATASSGRTRADATSGQTTVGTD